MRIITISLFFLKKTQKSALSGYSCCPLCETEYDKCKTTLPFSQELIGWYSGESAERLLGRVGKSMVLRVGWRMGFQRNRVYVI